MTRVSPPFPVGLLASPSQMPIQLTALSTILAKIAIDPFSTRKAFALSLSPPRNLLGTPPLRQQISDSLPFLRGRFPGRRRGLLAPFRRFLLRLPISIISPADVPLDLAIDRRTMIPQMIRYLNHGVPH